MGAYSFYLESTTDELDAIKDVDVEEILDDDEVEASFEESSYDAAMRAVAEITQNWNSIIEACAIEELHYLEENKTEMVYEGARLDAFVAKAKEFFLNIWEKIKAIFKKVLIQFNSWFKSDKEFIKKYEKDLNLAKNRGFGDKEIKWYNYKFYRDKSYTEKIEKGAESFNVTDLKDALNTIKGYSKVDVPVPANNDLKDWQDLNKKLNETETVKEVYDKFRGEFVGEGSVEAGEFVKKFKEHLQGGETKDDVKLATALPVCVDFLKSSENIKKHLNDLLAYNKKSIDNAIRCLNNIAKELKKSTSDGMGEANQLAGVKHSVATKVIEILKGHKNILVTANGVQLQCLKSASRQAKAVCVAALTYTRKKEDGVYQTEGASLLDKVRMI